MPLSEQRRQSFPAVAAFEAMFAELSVESVARHAREAYSEDAIFYDTLKEVRGAEAIARYLTHTARSVSHCSVVIDDVADAERGVYLRWTMEFASPRLASGKRLSSQGMSHLELAADGKIARHTDYWDAAAGFFEHVPVVGWVIRKIKNRL